MGCLGLTRGWGEHIPEIARTAWTVLLPSVLLSTFLVPSAPEQALAAVRVFEKAYAERASDIDS